MNSNPPTAEELAAIRKNAAEKLRKATHFEKYFNSM